MVLYGVYAPLIGALNGQRRFFAQAGFDILAATLRTVGLGGRRLLSGGARAGGRRSGLGLRARAGAGAGAGAWSLVGVGPAGDGRAEREAAPDVRAARAGRPGAAESAVAGGSEPVAPIFGGCGPGCGPADDGGGSAGRSLPGDAAVLVLAVPAVDRGQFHSVPDAGDGRARSGSSRPSRATCGRARASRWSWPG